MRNRTTAALLAFFLGGFGAQYFYLGRVGAGIICVLFCWTFIPCFIAFYHFIKFLVISDESFNHQYNREFLPAVVNRSLAAPVLLTAPQQAAFAVSVAPAVQTMSRSATQTRANTLPSFTDELERLFTLKEKGALTEEEYMVRKAKLLA